jgi:hypothetical protein
MITEIPHGTLYPPLVRPFPLACDLSCQDISSLQDKRFYPQGMLRVGIIHDINLIHSISVHIQQGKAIQGGAGHDTQLGFPKYFSLFRKGEAMQGISGIHKHAVVHIDVIAG